MNQSDFNVMWTKISQNPSKHAAELEIMRLADSDNVLRYVDHDDLAISTPRHCSAAEIVEDGREVPVSAVFGLFRGLNHLHGLGYAHNAVTIEHLLVRRDGVGILCGLSNVTRGTPVLYAADMYAAGVAAVRVLSCCADISDHSLSDIPLVSIIELITHVHSQQLHSHAGDPAADSQMRALAGVIHGCLRADPRERVSSRDAVIRIGFRPLD